MFESRFPYRQLVRTENEGGGLVPRVGSQVTAPIKRRVAMYEIFVFSTEDQVDVARRRRQARVTL